MPEMKPMSLPPEKMKAGDMSTYGKVLSVNPKIKWVTVTFQGQAGPYTQDLPKGLPFDFAREVPTAEETAAAELKIRLESLDHADQQAHTLAATAREKTATALASGKLPASSYLEDAYVYTQYAAIWDRVAHVSRVRAGETNEVDRLGAVKLIAAKISEEITDFARWRPLSRSTSATSNWIEDAELQAKGKFLEELKWTLLEG
jgi:hypothetical protein